MTITANVLDPTGANAGSGMIGSTFTADSNGNGAGSIGAVSVTNTGTNAFSHGIVGSGANDFTGFGIGAITSTTAGGDGILTVDIKVGAGGTAGIQGISTNAGAVARDGISGLTVTSGGAIGAIDGESASTLAGSTGITGSLIRSGAGIASITGKTSAAAAALGANGINASGFDAQESILGGVTATGSITNSLFIAGDNLGANFALVSQGVNLVNDLGGNAAAIGFDAPLTVGANADVAGVTGAIGAITLTGGAINNTSIIAGISTLGANIILDNPNTLAPNTDVFKAGLDVLGGVGLITAPGGESNIFVTGKTIGKTSVATGQIDTANYFASSATGTIDDVSVLAYNLPAIPTVANSVAINGSSFVSVGNIGNVSATILAGTANGGLGNDAAIGGGTVITAAKTVGNITGKVTAITMTAGSTAVGLDGVTVTGGTGIGAIEGDVTTAGLAGTNTIGINGGNYTATTGDITNITATVIDPLGTTNSVTGTTFQATVGNIAPAATITLTKNVNATNIFANANIGGINIAGAVDGSKIIAGDDFSLNNVTSVAGKSIGAVTISGEFRSSDLIASTNNAGVTFGDGLETENGGIIASVAVNTSAVPFAAIGNQASVVATTGAIEAHVFTAPHVTVGSPAAYTFGANGIDAVTPTPAPEVGLAGENGSVANLSDGSTLRVMAI